MAKLTIALPTLAQLRKTAKMSGAKIYAYVKLNDDEIFVELKKSSFLENIADWSEKDFQASEVQAQIVDGDIII